MLRFVILLIDFIIIILQIIAINTLTIHWYTIDGLRSRLLDAMWVIRNQSLLLGGMCHCAFVTTTTKCTAQVYSIQPCSGETRAYRSRWWWLCQ